MRNDPVVDEVHAVRDKIFAEHNYDLAAVVADLRQREKMHGNRVVNLRNRQNQQKDKAA